MEVVDRPIETPPVGLRRPFRRAAVLGAGVMGTQIAGHLANAGLEVELLDLPPEEGQPNALAETALGRARDMSPSPFFSESARSRIRPGNYADHLDRLSGVDWIIEAVIEHMDVKQGLLARIAPHVPDGTVVSSNTSGLSIAEMVEGLDENIRRRFLGTHFFNPPRYLKLLELIPTADTDQAVIEHVARFAETYLGKGVVVARDTPDFIANRVGVYTLARAMKEVLEGRYTIEEVDVLTGKLVGRPKSGTFRTADLVGLDTLVHVMDHLHETLPEPERDFFAVPDLLKNLVEKGRTGDKSGAGFYKKEGGEILSINPDSMRYESAAPIALEGLEDLREENDLRKRLGRLYRSDTRAGTFFRETTRDVLAYTAGVLPEIADGPPDVDRAMRWGFNHTLGPFQVWDALGFSEVLGDLRTAGAAIPEWIEGLASENGEAFYRSGDDGVSVWMPDRGYVPQPLPHYDLRLSDLRARPDRTVWENDESGLLDIGEQVALFEFRSKANTLGFAVISGLLKALEIVESGDWRGLVIGNEGANFSAGANLVELAGAVKQGKLNEIEKALARFQDAMQRVHYATKPVVTAVHQKALGGGCELVMATCSVVASAEAYIGLVEPGVGLIPAGGGTMRLAARAAEAAGSDHPSAIQPFLRKSFETVAKATVSTSAVEAKELGFLSGDSKIVMNDDRRIYAARETVIRLSNIGYMTPPRRRSVRVLGRPGAAQFIAALYRYEAARRISAYDRHIAERLAYVLTGGDLTVPSRVSEEYLLGLEREVFLSLLGESKTQERIEGLLKTGKPVRN